MIEWIKKTFRSLHGKRVPAFEPKPETPENTIPAKETKQTEPPRPSVVPTAKRVKKRKKPETVRADKKDAFQKNKTGIRILTDKDDLFEIFSEGIREDDTVEEKAERTNTPKYSARKNKKKVCVLTDEDDLCELFACDSEAPAKEPETGDDFRKLLERTLVGENFRTALREKNGNKPVRKKSAVRETIRAYPRPETELDLHGHTSVDVAAKVENEINSLRREGVRTLRIIVGKGLHSHGRAVLPDLVEKKLADLKRKGMVLTFRWEKRAKLKSGSIIVYLR